DNFGVFASEKDLDSILSESDIKGVKIGIGIGENARKALENATKALDLIRMKRDTQWKVLR
ncbi:MAG: GTP cyclohydrolase IIa, partial [Stygiolobus sp.]|nr:GTP cyclohydrolase IIa [Stygiolobus sp.]